jgi:surface antigen
MELQKFIVRKLAKLTLSTLALASLSGCLSTGLKPQSVAPVAPTAGLTLTSSQLLEPLKGGLIGGSLGAELSSTEKQLGLVAEYQALETSFGQTPVKWLDEKTANSGEVTAGAPYRVGQQDCRSFTHKLLLKAVRSTATGSACRQTNGTWLLLQ